jgi:Uma2 family endonuclease
MATATPKQKITPEHLSRMPDEVRFELVDGRLVERHKTVLSTGVAGRIFGQLHNYCQSANAGLLWLSSLGCRCFPNSPDNVRKPDVVMVRQERFCVSQLREDYLTIRPDLVVEVISPNDSAYEVDEKIEEYLAIAIPLIWIVNPETRTVEINRPDGTVTRLHANDEISGEEVLPGFRCRVEAFFPSAEK